MRRLGRFLICLISLAGLVSFFKLGRAEDPAFTVKVMTIVTAWPGATAQEMHDQVTEKIEKRMAELAKKDEHDLWLMGIEVEERTRMRRQSYEYCMQEEGYRGGSIKKEMIFPDRDFD